MVSKALGSGFTDTHWVELGGLLAGPVKPVTLPSMQFTRQAAAGEATPTTGVLHGPFEATCSPTAGRALLDWVLSLARDEHLASSGALLFADGNAKLGRRIDWQDARITATRFTTLDAAGREPFGIGFQWQAEQVLRGPAQGVVTGQSVQPKPWLAANFRAVGLPVDSRSLTRVELPALSLRTLTPSGLPSRFERFKTELTPLKLVFTGLAHDAVLAYVHKVMNDGVLSDDEAFDCQIEMLDRTLKRVVGSFRLSGCSLQRLEEAATTAEQDLRARYTLSFSVQRLDLTLPG